jgi:hypothetical protein
MDEEESIASSGLVQLVSTLPFPVDELGSCFAPSALQRQRPQSQKSIIPSSPGCQHMMMIQAGM